MEVSRVRAKNSGYGSLSSELLELIFTQPVLQIEDRLRALAVCKWWRCALADLAFAHLNLSWDARQDDVPRLRKQLLWAISTQPAVVYLEMFILQSSGLKALVSPVLHSVNRQALRKLEVTGGGALDLPCPSIFPGLQSLSLGWEPLGPDWLSKLTSLTHLTRLSLSVAPEAADGAGADGQSSVLSFPALPSLCALVLDLGGACSLTAPWGDMPALRLLRLTSGNNAASVDLSTAGTGLSRLEDLCLGLGGWARVDFALLPSLESLQLAYSDLRGAASVQEAASLTNIYFGLDQTDDELGQPWLAELVRSAPPSLRQLQLMGKWTRELAQALAGLQRLHTLAIESRGNDEQLPERTVWQHLQVLCWKSDSSLPLTLRGAPKLHTVHARLSGLRDLEVLRTLPALKHVTILEDDGDYMPEEEEEWQESATRSLVQQVLPHLESLEVWDFGEFVVPGGL